MLADAPTGNIRGSCHHSRAAWSPPMAGMLWDLSAERKPAAESGTKLPTNAWTFWFFTRSLTAAAALPLSAPSSTEVTCTGWQAMPPVRLTYLAQAWIVGMTLLRFCPTSPLSVPTWPSLMTSPCLAQPAAVWVAVCAAPLWEEPEVPD